MLIAQRFWEKLGIPFPDLEEMDPREVNQLLTILNVEAEMEEERSRQIEARAKSRTRQ